MLRFRQKKMKQAENTRQLMKNHHSGDIDTYMEGGSNKTKFSSQDL